jgi:hypothetical protein
LVLGFSRRTDILQSISQGGYNLKDRVVVSDAQTTTLDIFGAVTAGHITLTGFLAPVNLYVIFHQEHGGYVIYNDVIHHYIGIPGYHRREFECDEHTGCTHDELVPGYACNPKCVCGKCSIDPNTAQYYCLRIGSATQKDDGRETVDTKEHGLILRKSWTVYSALDRIGYFEWSSDEFVKSGVKENTREATATLV